MIIFGSTRFWQLLTLTLCALFLTATCRVSARWERPPSYFWLVNWPILPQFRFLPFPWTQERTAKFARQGLSIDQKPKVYTKFVWSMPISGGFSHSRKRCLVAALVETPWYEQRISRLNIRFLNKSTRVSANDTLCIYIFHKFSLKALIASFELKVWPTRHWGANSAAER